MPLLQRQETDFVMPGICPHCDGRVQTMTMLVICARCQLAWQWYEFVSDWRGRVPADILAVWELEPMPW